MSNLVTPAANQEVRPCDPDGQGKWIAASSYPTEVDQPAVCSWPLATTSGRAKLHQVLNGPSLTLWDWCDKEPLILAVQDIAASFIEFQSLDRPGEMVRGLRFYFLASGKVLHTASQGIAEALKHLVFLEGPPPWEPAILLRAERVVTRNHNTRLSLVFLGREESGTRPEV